jgi:hypothetical protein
MLDGLGAMLIPSYAEIAGDEIIDLAVRALKPGDKDTFLSLLTDSSRRLIEAMGNEFSLSSETGTSAAADFADALKQGKSIFGNSGVIHYETIVEGESFNFYVGYDGNFGEWRLGGL